MDVYLKSKNKDALEQIKNDAKNVIGPSQGRAEQPEGIDADGAITAAIDAVGDPAYWYVCVRFAVPIMPSGDIEACDEAEGRAVCGGWAAKAST